MSIFGNGNAPCKAELNVINGENDGWYAFMIWGGCGMTGRENGSTLAPADVLTNPSLWGADYNSNYGRGGCVKGLAKLSAGTYAIVAGEAAALYSDGGIPGGGYGARFGDTSAPLWPYAWGGGGGGYSGIFRGGLPSNTPGNTMPDLAVAVAGGGGGGGSHALSSGVNGAESSGGHGAGYSTNGINIVGTVAIGNHGGNITLCAQHNGAGGGGTHPDQGYSGGGTNTWGTAPNSAGNAASGQGGNFTNNCANSGGGGGGYVGGGAGGAYNYGTATTKSGGGGGGASFISTGYTYLNNFNGTAANNAAVSLHTSIISYLNDINALEQPNGRYPGKVVLVYLGPSDNIFDGDIVTNW